MNQLRIPPWLRVRTPQERQREREHLERLRWYERLAVLAGRELRPKEKQHRWLRQNSNFLGWEPDYLPEFVDRAVDREMAKDPLRAAVTVSLTQEGLR